MLISLYNVRCLTFLLWIPSSKPCFTKVFMCYKGKTKSKSDQEMHSKQFFLVFILELEVGCLYKSNCEAIFFLMPFFIYSIYIFVFWCFWFCFSCSSYHFLWITMTSISVIIFSYQTWFFLAVGLLLLLPFLTTKIVVLVLQRPLMRENLQNATSSMAGIQLLSAGSGITLLTSF